MPEQCNAEHLSGASLLPAPLMLLQEKSMGAMSEIAVAICEFEWTHQRNTFAFVALKVEV